MLFLIVCLFVLPYLYGRLFADKENSSVLLQVPVGLMVELVLWAVVSLPLVLTGGKFSTAVFIFKLCNLPCLGYGLALLLVQILSAKDKSVSEKKRFEIPKNVLFWIMIGCILFQAGRATIFQPSDYRDGKTYNALVNDIVETDGFFVLNDEDGSAFPDLSYVYKKYYLSSWYTFEALLSEVSGLHPLIVTNTILPGYLILLYYIVAWYLVSVFLTDDKLKNLFMIALAILNEFVLDDLTGILLVWPTWGKNITATIVVPVVIVLWAEYIKSRKIKSVLKETLVIGAGCAASNMGFMILPIEVFFLILLEMIKKRKIDIKLMLHGVVMICPVFVYALLFVLL